MSSINLHLPLFMLNLQHEIFFHFYQYRYFYFQSFTLLNYDWFFAFSCFLINIYLIHNGTNINFFLQSVSLTSPWPTVREDLTLVPVPPLLKEAPLSPERFWNINRFRLLYIIHVLNECVFSFNQFFFLFPDFFSKKNFPYV